MKNSKILVIGSQGYLGSRLNYFLRKYEYDFKGLDTGYFKNGVLGIANNSKDNYFNIENVSEKDLKDFDFIIQLADFSNDPIDKLNPKTFYRRTKNYTIKIAKICKKLGIKFLYPSSCSVYGVNEKILNEKSSTNPQTHYSKNKLIIENELKRLSDKNFVPIILRLATVFGYSPRIRFDVVINMLIGMGLTSRKIVLNSDGQSWRPHLFIDDICIIILKFIELKKIKNSFFPLNVGCNQNNEKIITVAKKIKNKIKNCELNYLNNNINTNLNKDLIKDRKITNGKDKRTYKVNFNKIHKIIKNIKFTSIENGIQKTINDLKKNKINLKKFQKREFYRLQQIEYLYKKGKLLIK
tara:strand:- start:247 stop:1305 length:1059 start_codon:yes stop_codon:yes gene_type:complete